MQNVRRVVLASTVAVVLLGCADASRITSSNRTAPVPQHVRKAMAPDGYEAPVFDSMDEVPGWWRANVWAESSRADWSGSTAGGYAFMRYTGNRISQTMHLTVIHKYSTVATAPPVTRTAWHFLPYDGLLGVPVSFAVSESCGQVVDLSTQHTAKIVLFIQLSFLELDEATGLSQGSARQPECPQTERCTDVTMVTYSPDDPECEGASGGGAGTGVFYQPGQSTGGSAVDFASGEGLQAGSVCGTAAVVEYVCIDILDAEGRWIEWACGYVTTC
jgi:hypothetical protein